MKNISYKITNEELFNANVVDVDFNNFAGQKGNLQIVLTNGNIIEFEGEHGASDYEDEYGFRLEF